jgi:hypothetical protein
MTSGISEGLPRGLQDDPTHVFPVRQVTIHMTRVISTGLPRGLGDDPTHVFPVRQVTIHMTRVIFMGLPRGLQDDFTHLGQASLLAPQCPASRITIPLHNNAHHGETATWRD